MNMLKRYMWIITILLLVLPNGCNKSDVETENEIKNTVRLYNTLLAEGYRKLNMSALRQVATERRATKAYFHMAANGEAKVKMDARLNALDFISINQQSDEKAEVSTQEQWHYVYDSLVTEEKIYENDVSYRLTYQLVKVSSRWLIDEIIIEESTEGVGSGKLPFIRRPSDN